MSESSIDQTSFAAQAPQPIPTPPPLPQKEEEGRAVRKPISLPIFIFVVVLILGLLLGAIYLSQRRSETVEVVPSPTASAAPLQNEGIRAEVQPYFDQINALNPETDDHPFPPVDFTVRIKDPNSKSNN